MRRTMLLSLLVLLAAGAAHHASAQRRGGGGFGFARGGYGFNRGRILAPNGFGYGYLPYDSGTAYPYYAPEPVVLVEPPPAPEEPPAPPPFRPVGHAVITEYKWPAAGSAASPAKEFESETQDFGIVLKNGSTLSAVMIYASDDGLHYVDPDERHLRVSMSEVDRDATLKLNRERNLNLHLPAAQ
jgi:hypothetical protein